MDGDGGEGGRAKAPTIRGRRKNQRPTDKDGGEESSPRRRNGRGREGGREGGRSVDGDRRRVAPSERQYREGGAAVTEGAGENCCCCLALTLPPWERERTSGMCCNARRRAGEQPVSSRRQSVAVGRIFGLWRRSNEVAHSPSGAPLANGVVDHQTTSGPPSLPSSHVLR